MIVVWIIYQCNGTQDIYYYIFYLFVALSICLCVR